MITRQAYVRVRLIEFTHSISISARDTSDPSKRPVPVPWDTFMQAVDVAKDVAAEREPTHHGLYLAAVAEYDRIQDAARKKFLGVTEAESFY